ncbi:hypothetical protein RG959_22210 [Domibacillus sp. 8LH]|uniref:hypothetical protein n=1 Tax=Domibacillus sp. 8LH TaxID=3073900 RepID=UPI00316FE85D
MTGLLLLNFLACEEGVAFSWEEARKFHIGETVYYLDGFKDPDSLFSQDHLSWMVQFKTEEGKNTQRASFIL